MKLNSKYSLELSEEAVSDLTDIQNYTFTNYGENQLKKYELILGNALDSILSFPNSFIPPPIFLRIIKLYRQGSI